MLSYVFCEHDAIIEATIETIKIGLILFYLKGQKI